MIQYGRPGRPPPHRLILVLMVMPFAVIDSFAALALALGIIDIGIHLAVAWAKAHHTGRH